MLPPVFLFYSMETWHWVLLTWLVFDVVVYLFAIADDYFYSHDVKGKFKDFTRMMTEE